VVEILTASSAAQKTTNIPQHVAIIMDGNGRWAKKRGLPRLAGHRAGTDNLRRVIEGFADWGVSCLTFYAFSTENWNRPRAEVRGLFRILREALDREVEDLHNQGIRIRHLGRLDRISPSLRRTVIKALELTKDNDKMTVCFAFNYGGRAEIVDAVRSLVASGVPADEITEEVFSRYLYSTDLPDPDLVIRTAGEMRLSNFLIWQAAYAEYYSTPVFWPDFDGSEINKAMTAYSRRERRFGALGPE
jgi:undecaprenyl diphosphate synthase